MFIAMLLIHVCTASVGLISGAMAMFLRKGSGLHGAAGTVFFGSMVCMASSGAFIAAFLRPNILNVVGGLLTLYLVTTAWWTARHREARTGVFDIAAFLFVFLVGVLGVTSGIEVAMTPTGSEELPAAMYFIFGTVALIYAASDVRMLRRGGVVGPKRIVRHLGRMCLALLIAMLSLYPGQAKLFPESLRETNLLIVPHILLIGSMIFWAARVGRKRRMERAIHRQPVLA